MADAPKVFISYSHDSDAYSDDVLQFAKRLLEEGVDAILDQHIPFPEEGWTLWMERNLREADWVLMLCTANYRNRVENLAPPSEGKGVRWEGKLIRQYLYNAGGINKRFIPVVPVGSTSDAVPMIMQDYTDFNVASARGYEDLYRLLTNQPRNTRPELGVLRKLDTRPVVRDFEPIWNVPHSRNPFFTGREEILATLHENLTSDHAAAITQAIAGLGGVGKTQTAVEYAYRNRADYPFILWAQANDQSTLTTEYQKIAAVLDLKDKDAQEAHKAVEGVKQWLAAQPSYLLILDNADDPQFVKAFLPPNPTGRVLITSREHNLKFLNVRTSLDMPTLPEPEAVAFMLERSENKEPSDADRVAAAELARELGYLPLALEQTAAYLAATGATVAAYLTSFRKRGLELLERHEPELGNYGKTVATTWSLSFDAVAKESAAAAELLKYCAFLAPEKIPEEIFTKGAAALGEPLATTLKDAEDDPLALDDLLAPILKYSLLQREPKDHTVRIHRLVQAVIRGAMSEEAQFDYAECIVEAVNTITPPTPDVAYWPEFERLRPHWLVCAEWIEQFNIESTESSLLLNQAGYYLEARAEYRGAEPLYRRSLGIREKVLGSDHPDTALGLNNLAELLRTQGDYSGAEPLFRRSLATWEQILGAEHPDTASSLNNLAVLLYAQSDYAGAEPLCRRSLAICEKVLGVDHPDTAQSLNNLAALLDTLGDYAGAEPLYRRSLAIMEKVLGVDHPGTALRLNNLAMLLSAQGDYAGAEPLFRRSLAIYEKSFGAAHPNTQTVRRNWEALKRKMGEASD